MLPVNSSLSYQAHSYEISMPRRNVKWMHDIEESQLMFKLPEIADTIHSLQNQHLYATQ